MGGRANWLSSCIGLEILILPDNSRSYRFCSISVSKESLSITDKIESRSLEHKNLKGLRKEQVFAVSLTGKGVLIKRSERINDLSAEKLVRIFPNVKPEEFYIQNFVSGGFSFIAMVRKTLVDSLLEELERAGIKVLSFTAGPFLFSHIIPQLNLYGNEVRVDGHRILAQNSAWEEYSYNPELKADFPVKIGLEPIKEEFVLAYATAFQLALLPRLEPVQLNIDRVTTDLEEYVNDQKVKNKAILILFSFFCCLLINFVVFTYYNDKNEELLAKVSQYTESTDNFQQIQQSISENERFLDELAWNKGIRAAWLADQIGQTLPNSVKLTELSISPLDKNESSRERKEIYERGRIRLAGEAAAPGLLNEWLYVLKSRDWVKKVSLESFSPSAENEKQIFSISIFLK